MPVIATNKINIKLYNADCLDKMKDIPDKSVDLVLTDPPYGTTACKWDSIIPLEPMWEHLKRVIKPNGAIVMTAGQPFTTTLISSNMKMFKYCWVWEKTRAAGHLNAKKQPMRKTEDVVVFFGSQCIYNPQGLIKGKFNNSSPCKANKRGGETVYGQERVYGLSAYKNYPHNILKFSNPNNDTIHPTQKPVALMEYLIKTYTNEGETVLDFTMGSGTTGVACKLLNRNFIGIELSEEYFKIAQNRINQTEQGLF